MARDEAGYDKLSALGHQQAAWLGTYLRLQNQHHTRLFTGTLIRHIETAEAMETGLEPARDARLNEIEYFTLASALEAEHNIPVPNAREEFVTHLPILFTKWQRGEIEAAPETFEAFETRVRDVIQEISTGEGPALVITSGGFISMAMRNALRLDTEAMASVALAIFNTSQHRLFPMEQGLIPALFNAIPHLEDPDRHFAQTHL
jgi:broad specificity phosphatase PhoE